MRRINQLVNQAQIRARSNSQDWPGMPTRLLTDDERKVLSSALSHGFVRIQSHDGEDFVVATEAVA